MRNNKSILTIALTSAIALTMVGCGTTSTEKEIASNPQDYVVTYEDGNIHLREDVDVEQEETTLDYDPDMVVDVFSELEPYLVYSGHDKKGQVDLQFPEGFKWQVGDYYFKKNESSYYNVFNVIYDNEIVNTISYHVRTPESGFKAGEEFTVYTICESSLNQMFKDTGSEYVVLDESKYDNSSVHVTTTVEKNYVFPSIATPLKNYSDFKDEYMDTIQQYVADYWHNSAIGRENHDVEVCEAVFGYVKEGEIALYGGEKAIIYVGMSVSGKKLHDYALTGLAISNDGEFLINGIEDAGYVYSDSEELLTDRLAASDVNEAYDLFVLKSSAEKSTEEENYGETADIKGEGVMTYSQYANAALNTKVVIEAYVQAKQSWWDNKGTFYLQDKDGAYFVYNMGCTEEEYNKLISGTKIKVTGFKTGWAGQVEIIDAAFEILEGNYVAEAMDVTGLLGTEELINHQNKLVSFNGLTVEASINAYGNEVAFLYGWDGSGQEGTDSDLYFNASVNGTTYTFVVEYYLYNETTDVYNAVKNLGIGDTIDIEGFLYWYEGAQPHVTYVIVK